jgi:hypothetical protein
MLYREEPGILNIEQKGNDLNPDEVGDIKGHDKGENVSQQHTDK